MPTVPGALQGVAGGSLAWQSPREASRLSWDRQGRSWGEGCCSGQAAWCGCCCGSRVLDPSLLDFCNTEQEFCMVS